MNRKDYNKKAFDYPTVVEGFFMQLSCLKNKTHTHLQSRIRIHIVALHGGQRDTVFGEDADAIRFVTGDVAQTDIGADTDVKTLIKEERNAADRTEIEELVGLAVVFGKFVVRADSIWVGDKFAGNFYAVGESCFVVKAVFSVVIIEGKAQFVDVEKLVVYICRTQNALLPDGGAADEDARLCARRNFEPRQRSVIKSDRHFEIIIIDPQCAAARAAEDDGGIIFALQRKNTFAVVANTPPANGVEQLGACAHQFRKFVVKSRADVKTGRIDKFFALADVVGAKGVEVDAGLKSVAELCLCARSAKHQQSKQGQYFFHVIFFAAADLLRVIFCKKRRKDKRTLQTDKLILTCCGYF